MSQIGEGGMGEVWRASHKLLARPAAIKLVKLDDSRQELFAHRFRREANTIAALKSPHTVYLYDFGTTQDGRLYYVMELLDGISLQTLIDTFGPQPASRVVAILKQMCRSLEEAHQAQIVHRDLKPSNVMICEVAQAHDFVKVLDFGLAKPFGAGAASNLTVEGITLGTPEYMAPEVGRGSRTVDARADLYALGCVAYVLLTGALVFTDSSPVAVALKHMRTPPVPPSRRTDNFDPARSRARDSRVPRERPERPSTVGAERRAIALRLQRAAMERRGCRCLVADASAADVSTPIVLTSSATGAVARAESVNMKTSEPRTLVTHPELKSHQSLPVFKTLGEPPKSALERLLSIFADVRAGEGVGALLLALNVFLLLAGYSVMRPARDGLILSEGGAEAASYSAAAQAILLTAVVPLYGWLGTRVRAYPPYCDRDDVFLAHARRLLCRGPCRTA